MTARLELHIDWDRVLGTKSPLLFGYFVEHFHRQVYGGIYQPGSPLSGPSGLRTDVLDAVRRLRPSTIRWPGGCFASSYHWRDGVHRPGPLLMTRHGAPRSPTPLALTSS